MDANGGVICPIAIECDAVFNECVADPAWGEQTWIHPAQAHFNLWCAGLKATRADKSSLDYRLRGHPDVQKVIRNLLIALVEALHKCQQRLSGE